MRDVWQIGRNVGKIGATALTALVVLSPPALAQSQGVDDYQRSLGVVGLTDDQRLVRFKTEYPDKVQNVAPVSGLDGDTALIGIDYRVQNNLLYGVGNTGGIYIINPDDGHAAKVSQLSVALEGNSYDVDFNPAANRLRVISDTGQNLRHNLDDPNGAPPIGATAVDTALTTPPTADITPGVTAAAYTNDDLDPTTGTALYDIDTAKDALLTQSPANAGTLAANGQFGVDAGSNAGFDVYSAIQDETTVGLRALATLQVDGYYGLYEVDLFTAKITALGNFHSAAVVVDIAIPLNQY